MAINQLSLAVVGMRFPNKKRGNRQFEIEVCLPGEPVQLVHEPKNPADQNAIAVMSARGIQMGYVSAERTWLIHRAWQEAQDVAAIFQAKADFGAWIRVGIGEPPVLPPVSETPPAHSSRAHDLPEGADPDSEFWPDEIPPD